MSNALGRLSLLVARVALGATFYVVGGGSARYAAPQTGTASVGCWGLIEFRGTASAGPQSPPGLCPPTDLFAHENA